LFQFGAFVLCIKDKRNVDNFSIWRIESSILLKKFEPFVEKGLILHRPVKTVSISKDTHYGLTLRIFKNSVKSTLIYNKQKNKIKKYNISSLLCSLAICLFKCHCHVDFREHCRICHCLYICRTVV